MHLQLICFRLIQQQEGGSPPADSTGCKSIEQIRIEAENKFSGRDPKMMHPEIYNLSLSVFSPPKSKGQTKPIQIAPTSDEGRIHPAAHWVVMALGGFIPIEPETHPLQRKRKSSKPPFLDTMLVFIGMDHNY